MPYFPAATPPSRLADEHSHTLTSCGSTTACSTPPGALLPIEVRSLDAVHLATAQQLGADVHHLVTYDDRMAEAARLLGVRTATPT